MKDLPFIISSIAAKPKASLAVIIRWLFRVNCLTVIALIVPPLAIANPTGGQVAAGVADIARQNARMDINQASQRAVINWNKFSIDRGEHVNFNQPNRDASTLNRVMGNDPSAIMGKMTANGNVYLVNQNGIMVGKGAQINVGSLTASTANISNSNFMAGNLRFDQPGDPNARITNRGDITVQQGGLVALVAPGVANHGAINAKLGKVALASGEVFTLDLYGDQLINLTVSKEQLKQIPSADGKPLSHFVSNTGEITAEGGIVTLMAGTGKAIVDSMINLKGRVQAQSVENRNGVITLLGDERTKINMAGTLDASGKTANSQGGKVEIRGGQVNLKQGSLIDVSAQGQAGTVLVGGDYQGSGAGVRANTTNVARNAVINADSNVLGNGGKVIVWADKHTSFDGKINARGGQIAGNGGLVEVSGKQTLHFNGDVDARSTNGKAGTLLLDPGDLVVRNLTRKQNQNAAKITNNGSFSTARNAAVNVQKVNFLLQNGTDVSLKANRDLTVASKIDGRATNGLPGAGLSLSAGRNANINQDVVTNNGAIKVNAQTGNITMAVGKTLDAGNQAISLNAGKNVDAQNLVTTGAINVKAGQTVALNQDLVGLTQANQAPSGIGSLRVEGNAINVKGNVKTNNGDQTYLSQGGNFVLERGANTLANRLDSGTGKITIDAKGQGDAILNGTVLAKQAGLKITTQQGDVTFNEALGFAKKNPDGTEAPDPEQAVGSVQVRSGGKITVNQDWNLNGNNADCNGGDCSVKIVQTGGNDIVINGRIKTATGNILVGSDDYSKTGFGTDKIQLGNSIFTGGAGNSIFINGNLHLVDSGRTDKINRETTISSVRDDGSGNSIPGPTTTRSDPINAITLSAAKGSLKVAGNISGLWVFNDVNNTRIVPDFDNPGDFGQPGTKQFTSYTTTSQNLGGVGLRLVAARNSQGSGDLGFSTNTGIPNTKLFDVFGNQCCEKISIDNSYISAPPNSGAPTISFRGDINQAGRIQNSNEYHYLVINGVLNGTNNTRFDMNANSSTNQATPGLGREAPLRLSEFNQLNSNIARGEAGAGVSDPDLASPSNNPNSPNNSGTSSNITRQTLAYASETEQVKGKKSTGSGEDGEEVIVLSSNSDAENADLGRSSPETGAIQKEKKPQAPVKQQEKKANGN